MVEGDFDIYVFGGSETIASAREFLLRQEQELGGHRQAFDSGCREEGAAMDNALKMARGQVEHSAGLAEAAQRGTQAASQAMYSAEGAVSSAEREVASARQHVEEWQYRVQCAETAVRNCQGAIGEAESHLHDLHFSRDCEEGCIKNIEHTVENQKKELARTPRGTDAFCSYQGEIKWGQQELKREEEKLREIDGEIKTTEKKLAELKRLEGKLESLLATIRGGLEKANRLLDNAQAVLDEAGKLKAEAERVVQDSDKADAEAKKNLQRDCWQRDCVKKATRESREELDGLQGSVAGLGAEDSENLLDSAEVMRELAQEMQAYENFGLEG